MQGHPGQHDGGLLVHVRFRGAQATPYAAYRRAGPRGAACGAAPRPRWVNDEARAGPARRGTRRHRGGACSRSRVPGAADSRAGPLIGIGAYVAPAISDYLSRRRARAAAVRERLERVSASAVIPVPLSEPGPAALLRPDRQVVGFIDRPELGRLREWCDDGGQPRVLLLTGAGGVGKTRLALQLAREQEASGWVCRVVRPDEEADAVPAVRAVSSGPVLLVIDYAETRSGLAGSHQVVATRGFTPNRRNSRPKQSPGQGLGLRSPSARQRAVSGSRLPRVGFWP